MAASRLKTKLTGVILGLTLAVSANANLIVNGGFEANEVAAGSWSYYSSANVDGWEGSNIEIWDNMGGVAAPEGRQIAELNAHPYTGGIFSIYQSFATVVGKAYDVSFYYRARASNNEVFSFSVGGLNTVFSDHVVGSWKQYANSFVANNAVSTIRFTSADNSTIGNLLDGVVVNAKASVPESSSLGLLAIGMLGLILQRRKIRA